MDIGASSPEEIAVSILAQIVQLNRAKPAIPGKEQQQAEIRSAG